MASHAPVLGEVLAQEAVGVLGQSSLPGTVGIAEVDLDVGVDGELEVLLHLPALVPGQGLAEALGQGLDLLGQPLAGTLGVDPSRQLEEHDVAAAPLHQGADGVGGIAQEEVTLPVSGHGAVGHLRGPLADVDHVFDVAAPAGLPPPRLTYEVASAQMLSQLPAQHTSTLHVEREVDRLR